MANNNTRIIKFRAEFEETKDFGKWLQDIEKNIDSSVDNSFNKWIKEYKTRLEALVKTINGAGETPSDNIMTSMHKEMKGMLELSKKIVNHFSQISLGDAGEKLKSAANAVQAASKNKRNAQANERNWKSKLSIDGQTLSDNELKRIYEKNSAKGSFDFNGVSFGGAGGADLATFIAEVKKNIELLKNAESGVAKAIQDRFNDIQTHIGEYAKEAVNAAQELEKAKKEFTLAASAAVNDSGSDAGAQAVRGQEIVNNTAVAADSATTAFKDYEADIKAKTEATAATSQYNKENQKTPNVVAKAAKQVFAYGTVVSLFKKLVSGAKRTITELDAAFTNMAVVTNLTREQAWGMVEDFQRVAKETGAVTSEVAATTTKFLQQGKSLSQAAQLSEAALKAAKIAGIDASTSVDLLTNAMNGFQMSASQALEVSDKFAALAASSATNYEELAVALSKVAAQANLAGISMDFTLGMLAKGIEVTREAPETIGTALKTVISRMRELSDYGETLEEGMDVNRVETALENVGVKLRDTNGQFRNLEDVLSELGGKWDELNTNQQANVAVALAGTRQQSRLIAMMQDFDRTLELVDISTNSYGATMAQHMEYMGSMQAATDSLKTSYEGLIAGIVNSDFAIGAIETLTKIVDAIDWILNEAHLLVPVVIILAMHGLNILNTKIIEWHYQKQINKLAQDETLIKNKIRLGEIAKLKTKLKEKEAGLKQLVDLAKQEELEEEITKEVLMRAKAKAQEAGDLAAVAGLDAQIAEMSQDDAQNAITVAEAKEELLKTQHEIAALNAEELKLNTENAHIQTQQALSLSNLSSGLGGILTILSAITGVLGVINVLRTIGVALLGKERVEMMKNWVVEKAHAAWTAIQNGVKTTAALIQSALSAAHIPYAGWVIAIALLAAAGVAVGVGVANAFSSAEAQEKRAQKAMEKNIEAMQQLQGEIYNLGNSLNTVSALADEFESLSSKINKTAEDTARLKEIITEFNDAAGYNLLDTSMTYDEVLNKMRAYEASIAADLHNKIEESNKTLKQGIKTFADLSRYMNNSEGRAVIQQNLAQNYSEFAGASDTTKSVIMDAIGKNAHTFVGAGGGLNYNLIEKTFSAKDIELMDQAISSGSLAEYKNALNEMSAAAATYIKRSDSLFKHVSRWSGATVASIDNLKLTADQMAELSPILEENADKIQQWTEENGGQSLSKGELMNKLYENRLSTEDAARKVTQAQSALDAYASSSEYKKFAKIKEEVEEAGGVAEAKLSDKEKKIYEDGMNKLAGLQTDIEEAKKAQDLASMSAQEWWNTYGNIPTLTDLQSNIDKVNSSMDKFTKFAAGELDGKDMDELLASYPELIDYMIDGTITANELNEARNNMYKKQKDELQETLELIEQQNIQIMEESLKGTGLTWDSITNRDAEAVKGMLAAANITDEVANSVLSKWRDYQQTKIKADNFVETLGMTESELKRVAESTGLVLAEAQHKAYKEELELYAKEDPEYAALFGQSMQAAGTAIAEAKKEKEKLYRQIKKQLGNYDFEIIDGNIYYKNSQGLLQSLDSLEGAAKQAFGTVAESMADVIKQYSDVADTEKEYAESIANEYIEMKTEELEQEKEILNKRKEAYEDYFEAIDYMSEDQDRTQSKESIIQQIAALAGGIDAASKNKIKELQQELQQIQKDEIKQRQEQERNALLNGLDEETEKLDADIKNLDDSIGLLIKTILATAGGSKFQYKEGAGTLVQQLESWLERSGKGYASGGLVDYTGLAMVHGSSNRPESFLNADDTALLADVLNSLHAHVEGASNNISTTEENNNSIVIDSINIKTEQLNTAQDFKNAGALLAQEFSKIIRSRGLNINVKK